MGNINHRSYHHLCDLLHPGDAHQSGNGSSIYWHNHRIIPLAITHHL